MQFNTKLINIVTKSMITNTCINIKWVIMGGYYDERRNQSIYANKKMLHHERGCRCDRNKCLSGAILSCKASGKRRDSAE